MLSFATNEPSDQLWLERSINAAGYLGAMGYGVHLAVFATATYYILHQKKIVWRWLIFNALLFVLGTIDIACTIHFNQLAWIDERGYPGGPHAFLTHEQNKWVVILGTSAGVVAAFMADGLLLYRVFIIWNWWYVLILPTILYVATIILSTANIVQSGHPYQGTWGPNLSLACWSMSMTLNILLTIILASRLLYMRRKIQAAVSGDYGKAYTSVAAMIIESALPMTIVSFVFIVLFAKQTTAENLLVPLISQIECISPQLIIIRVIRGRAWSRDTLSGPMSKLEFGETPPALPARQSMTQDVSGSISFIDRSTTDVEDKPSHIAVV